MSGPISNVSQSNDPYGGGTLQRAGRPDQGPTGTLGGFVSSGRPPAVTPAAVRDARNYRGTNVTIPYARVGNFARIRTHRGRDRDGSSSHMPRAATSGTFQRRACGIRSQYPW